MDRRWADKKPEKAGQEGEKGGRDGISGTDLKKPCLASARVTESPLDQLPEERGAVVRDYGAIGRKKGEK